MNKACRIIFILLIAFVTAGCSRDVNEHIRRVYGIGSELTSESEDKLDLQESKASDNADTAYRVMDETSRKQFYDAVNMEATDDGVPFQKKVVGWMYTGYARLKVIAPYVVVGSVVVGIIVFIFSSRNNGLRRFALFGLIIGVPFALILVIYGYGWLADIFMY